MSRDARPALGVGDPLGRVRGVLAARPLAVLAVVALLSQAVALRRVLAAPGRPRLHDSRIFEYYGWRIARGDRLYVDLWEIKPPLSFEVTGLLAGLAGGDVWRYHLLAVLVTGLAAVGCVVLVGAHVEDLTGDGLAAVTAGLFLYTLPAFHLRAAFGFKTKYLTLFAALLALWLVRHERPFGAGLAAAAAVGTWQLAVAVPAVVLALAWRDGAAGAVRRVCAGGALGTAVVLGPVLYWGALEAMVVETVLVPLTVDTGRGILWTPRAAVTMFDDALPLVAVGLGGLLAAGVGRDRGRTWWVAAVGGWFLAVVVLLDFDGYPDVFPLLAFLAVGLGLVVARADGWSHRAVVAGTVLVAVLSVAVLGGYGPFATATVGDTAPAVAAPADVSPPYTGAEMRALLWHDLPPRTCHVFVGRTQFEWIQAVDGRWTDATCGEWPS